MQNVNVVSRRDKLIEIGNILDTLIRQNIELSRALVVERRSEHRARLLSLMEANTAALSHLKEIESEVSRMSE